MKQLNEIFLFSFIQIRSDEDEELRLLTEIQQALERASDDNQQSANRYEDGDVWPENCIFGEICAKFLDGQCYRTYCDFSHNFPSKNEVELHLKLATRDQIEQVQNKILLRHDNLLMEYLSVFCTFFGRKWLKHRESLRLLVSELSKKIDAPILIKEIFNGFLISGMKYGTCVNQLLNEIDDSLNEEEQFEIMWQLIIDPSNEQIQRHLKEFDEILKSDALVATDAINKLMTLQINDDLEELRATVIDIVKKTSVITFLKIDSKLLRTYIKCVQNYDSAAAKAIQQKAAHFGKVF